MPAKRTRQKARAITITPEIIEAWRALRADPDDRAAYLIVHQGLALKPWSTNPIDVAVPSPPGTAGHTTHPHAVELRRALNIAAGLPENA